MNGTNAYVEARRKGSTSNNLVRYANQALEFSHRVHYLFLLSVIAWASHDSHNFFIPPIYEIRELFHLINSFAGCFYYPCVCVICDFPCLLQTIISVPILIDSLCHGIQSCKLVISSQIVHLKIIWLVRDSRTIVIYQFYSDISTNVTFRKKM